MDADGALGIHIGAQMMQIAIDKAKEYGTSAVTAFDSGHLGGCGYYAAQAAQQGMIGLCMTGGHFAGTRRTGGMVPTFGAEPRLGTNPIAWAAPSRSQAPFLFDIASTQIANNKIGLARRIGIELEPQLDHRHRRQRIRRPSLTARRILPPAVRRLPRKRLA